MKLTEAAPNFMKCTANPVLMFGYWRCALGCGTMNWTWKYWTLLTKTDVLTTSRRRADLLFQNIGASVLDPLWKTLWLYRFEPRLWKFCNCGWIGCSGVWPGDSVYFSSILSTHLAWRWPRSFGYTNRTSTNSLYNGIGRHLCRNISRVVYYPIEKYHGLVTI